MMAWIGVMALLCAVTKWNTKTKPSFLQSDLARPGSLVAGRRAEGKTVLSCACEIEVITVGRRDDSLSLKISEMEIMPGPSGLVASCPIVRSSSALVVPWGLRGTAGTKQW